MAFKNVELLKEEIKEYQIPNYRVIKPGVGTVDREKILNYLNIGQI